jgi:hypothetical protein
MADANRIRQVDDPQVGVGGTLGEEERGVVPQRVGELLGVGRLDDRGLDLELREVVPDELPRTPIAVVGHDQMPAPGQQGEEGGRGGAHARGEEDRSLCALELAELALHRAPGGVAVAPVLVALLAPLLIGAHLLRILEHEGGGLVDGGGDGVTAALVALAAVNGARGLPRSRRTLLHPTLSLGWALSTSGADPRKEGPGACKRRKSSRFSNPRLSRVGEGRRLSTVVWRHSA